MANGPVIIPTEVIDEAMGQVAEILVLKFRELGMPATGKWERELEIRSFANRGELWGMNYTEQLALGRAPGKQPPIAPLELWVQAKFGLSGKEATSAAWALATKIAKEGTTWWPAGSDLLEVLESDEVYQAFYSVVQEYLVDQVTITIQEDLRRLNVS